MLCVTPTSGGQARGYFNTKGTSITTSERTRLRSTRAGFQRGICFNTRMASAS